MRQFLIYFGYYSTYICSSEDFHFYFFFLDGNYRVLLTRAKSQKNPYNLNPVKGINLSLESKISGFSSNVGERLKLLGCVQTVFPRKKTAATIIFQDTMKSEAVAMQDEGGNIVANNLIFHAG